MTFFILNSLSWNFGYGQGSAYDTVSDNLNTDLEEIGKVIDARLGYMKAVAAYKWENQLAIEDIEREKVVIDASQEAAYQVGLDSLSTRLFFEFQIDLAKKIQEYWFDEWKADNESPVAQLDLQREIRPELIRLGDEIIQNTHKAKLNQYPKNLVKQKEDVFINQITTKGLTQNDKSRLFEMLVRVNSLSN